MQISKKQRAIINSAVKPFYITSNYLGTGLQNLIKLYSKYFARRRFTIVHFLPTYKNSRNSHRLTVLYNAFLKRGGYAKKRRPATWNFYGNTLLTRYGRKKQRKLLKNRRKKARRQKSIVAQPTSSPEDTKENSSDSVVIVRDDESDPKSSNESEKAEVESISTPADQNADKVVTPIDQLCATNDNESDPNSNAENSDLGDDVVENIWNLDIQEVAALITETGNDERQLSESGNGETDNNSSVSNEDSISTENHHDDEPISCVDEESQDQSKSAGGSDLSEKIRQQLKLLKMGKSDNFLFTSKDSRSTPNTRNSMSAYRRSNSNQLDEPKKMSGTINSKSAHAHHSDSSKQSDNTKAAQKSNDNVQKSKSNGGIIDSLFNKFQSINSSISTRMKTKSVNVVSPNILASTPSKRPKRDEIAESLLATTFDSTQDDSNQSANSVSMEFLGFDISNKNMDVSALLPTPKVMSSNDQAAFVSEYLDMFMKENSLEKSTDYMSFAPKRRKPDEALMTIDALPPNLSVPERPMDMQRPRTLAEKRMILQQQNDISILIIENESTVYHELKKRVRQGSEYDNTLMRSIQDAQIPFTRDCWRATCWISTPNNRFFYRTILLDGQEIKLTGSRGDNSVKVSFEINTDEKKPIKFRPSKSLLAECSKKCLPIEGIRINNMETILNETKVKPEDTLHPKEKFGLLKRAKLCMFSREYLTPGPKCKKVNCKSNRKTSFDLEYGPLELVQLPIVQLEVWPQVGLPLSDNIKPLLKTIPVNSNVITSDWAKFAVSVVRENPKQVKQRRKYKKPEAEQPLSITFNIPYENHEKMILIRRRRRSSITFSKSDTAHEKIESFYENDVNKQLTFGKDVDPDDTISVECANILTNMIESVAITVNDSNFVKQDPDIDYVGKVVPVGSAKDLVKSSNKIEKDKLNTKTENASKSKLIKELKRLNVTVINTANDSAKSKKTDEICHKPYCRLGCVCESIDSAKYVQTHCQLVECMFRCKCINTPFKQGNPFYFNNNIDMLHAQANARLAKEEKEFKSTIIVSENDMFVLPNSSTATKRSSKKPKRFTNDETCLEDTETETIFKSKRRRHSEKVVDCPAESRHRYSLLKSLQHVRVEVKPLPDLRVEPWCMIHCLYKCHCKGRAQKGRIFNFANKKNDLTGPGGWDLITPRKRQYTFERDSASASGDEPATKIRRTVTPEIRDVTIETFSSARTSEFSWKTRPRRTPLELKTFRNECMFIEDQQSTLLNQRIIMCRNYTQAQNTLTRSMKNGQLVAAVAKTNVIANGSIQSANKPTNESLQHLNNVITATMHRLTALQERTQLFLNTTPNKMSIIPWDRMLHAFKSNDIFIWDVTLEENHRLLVLTTTFTKPKSINFRHITNINYADINTLPMVAKLIRNEYQSDHTKYLAMVLLRMSHFWRICGVLHSDVKYMDDELRAKPTPDQNPHLSRKINALYQVLTRCSAASSNSQQLAENSVTIVEIQNDANIAGVSSNDSKLTANVPKIETVEATEENNDTTDDDNNDDVKEVELNESPPFFENTGMKLSLPIPVASSQRLLMLNVGDDFTHVWFPSWHKFLSIKRIYHSFSLSMKYGKAIEMTQSSNYPKVFVSPSHIKSIFIGPYGKNDRQNLALFVKHQNHMMLAETYYKENGNTYSKKTKASWVYPSSPAHRKSMRSYPSAPNTLKLKIDQVFPNHNVPTEITSTDEDATNDGNASTSTDKQAEPHCSNNFVSNGIKNATVANRQLSASVESNASTSAKKPSVMPPKKIFIPTKVIELPAGRLAKASVDANPYSNSNSLSLKISSVASGESVALMTNGLPITFDETDELDEESEQSDMDEMTEMNETNEMDETNVEPFNRDVQSPSVAQENSTLNPTLELTESNTNELSEPLLISIKTKRDSIDISDDEEQRDLTITSDVRSVAKESKTEKFTENKGYIYCSTNPRLGKVNIEWTSANCIKLYLTEPIDIECVGEMRPRRMHLTYVSEYMRSYIRKRFYGVSPAHLRLDWVYVDMTRYEQDATNLCDFNQVEPFSVVFRDKIVNLKSNYRDKQFSKEDIYVLDIYQLASQIFSKDEVKSMNIFEILEKCREIEAQLNERQNKLKHQLVFYQNQLKRCTTKLANQTQNQNGEV